MSSEVKMQSFQKLKENPDEMLNEWLGELDLLIGVSVIVIMRLLLGVYQ